MTTTPTIPTQLACFRCGFTGHALDVTEHLKDYHPFPFIVAYGGQLGTTPQPVTTREQLWGFVFTSPTDNTPPPERLAWLDVHVSDAGADVELRPLVLRTVHTRDDDNGRWVVRSVDDEQTGETLAVTWSGPRTWDTRRRPVRETRRDPQGV